MTQIEIDLNGFHKDEEKSTGRPGLVKKKVTVKRGGKTFQQYRWVKSGVEEPTEKPSIEKPKKELAIMGLNKPEDKPEPKIELSIEEIRRKNSLEAISNMDLKVGDTVNYMGHSYPVEGIDENGIAALGGAGYNSAWAQYLEKPSKGEELPPHPPDKAEVKPKKPKKTFDAEKARSEMMGYVSKVDDDELDAMVRYTDVDDHSGNYNVLNWYLRTGEVDPDNKANVEKLIGEVSSFLKNAPKVKGTVYRGMSWSQSGEGTKEFEAFLKEMEEGKSGKVKMQTFTSTSAEPSIVEDLFVGTEGHDHTIRFDIKSKSGVFLGDLSEESEEQEVLFDKDTAFKIKKIDRSGYPDSVKISMVEV